MIHADIKIFPGSFGDGKQRELVNMAIKSIEVMNVMVFRRQWRNHNDDCKTGIKAGDVLQDALNL